MTLLGMYHLPLYDFTITSRLFLFFEYRPERFQRASRLRKDGHWIVASNPSKGSARLYNTNPEDVQDWLHGSCGGDFFESEKKSQLGANMCHTFGNRREGI